METKYISINSLYLDPNNYRFRDSKSYVPISAENLFDSKVQQRTCRMLWGKNNEGIADLLQSIKTNGYIALEPLQVVEYEKKHYLVTEGNRRVATLKYLQQESEKGEGVGHFDISVLSKIQVQVIPSQSDSKRLQLIEMGLHHLSGKKRWNPINQSQMIEDLHHNYHMSVDEICQSLGLYKQTVNKSLRALALIRAYKDSDYGDQFQSDMYSIFEEIVKSPSLFY